MRVARDPDRGRRAVVVLTLSIRCDLRQADRRTVVETEDHRPEGVRGHQLAVGADGEGPGRSEQLAGRQVHVGALQQLVDFVDANPLRPEPIRIDLHADGVLLAAEHVHLRDAAERRDLRRDQRLRVAVDFRQRPGIELRR
jgi:hypothetical protein